MSGSCTISGEPVLLDYGNNVEAMIANRLRSFVWPQFSPLDGKLASNPIVKSDFDAGRFTLPYSEPPSPRINEWISPTGVSRYGRGFFLLSRQSMEVVAAHAFGFVGPLNILTVPDQWDANAGTPYATPPNMSSLDFFYTGFGAFYTPVWILQPMKVDAEGVDLWILPVVDNRYTLLRSTNESFLHEGINHEDAIYQYGLFNHVDVDVDPIDPRYQILEYKAFDQQNVSAGIALEALILGAGRRAYFDHFFERIKVQSAADAISRLTEIFDEPGVTLGDKSPMLTRPESILVSGPVAKNYVRCGESWQEEAMIPDGAGTDHKKSLYTTFYKHNFTHEVDEEEEYPEMSANAANSAAGAMLLEVIGDDYDAWKHKPGFVIAPGIREWLDCSCFDYVSYYIKGTDSVYTSAVTLPLDFYPLVNFSQWENHYLHSPDGSGWWFKSGSDGVPGRTGIDEPGFGLCKIYRLVDFFPTSPYLLPAHTYANNPTEEIPVYNISTSSIAGDTFFQADTVECNAVASPGGGQSQEVIRFRFAEPYEQEVKQRACFYIHLSYSGATNPEDPPTVDGAFIFYHGRLVDVETVPNGSAYHTHLWLIEHCFSSQDDYDNYLFMLNLWINSQEPWEGEIIEDATCSEVDQEAIKEAVLDTPGYAYEIEVLVDEEPTYCEPPEPTCPLPEKTAGNSAIAKVVSRPCGVSRVPGEDEDGNVTVVDSTGRFLGGREQDSWLGKEGFAVRVYDVEESDEYDDCYWMIIWIDWFESIELVSDVVIGGNGITISRKEVEVWRHCSLEDEEIEGEDCEGYAA